VKARRKLPGKLICTLVIRWEAEFRYFLLGETEPNSLLETHFPVFGRITTRRAPVSIIHDGLQIFTLLGKFFGRRLNFGFRPWLVANSKSWRSINLWGTFRRTHPLSVPVPSSETEALGWTTFETVTKARAGSHATVSREPAETVANTEALQLAGADGATPALPFTRLVLT
jgi:hypothetical protein